MLKTIYLGMDKVDANILLELLDSHVRAGECWGVKKHHSARTTTPVYCYTVALIDKRVDNLIVRLKEALND
jgi:hypothetical protein